MLEEAELVIDVRVAKAIRGLLVKAVELLDASIKNEERAGDGCAHNNRIELMTMGNRRGNNQTYLCDDCGEQFVQEVEDGQPETLGRRRGAKARNGALGNETGASFEA